MKYMTIDSYIVYIILIDHARTLAESVSLWTALHNPNEENCNAAQCTDKLVGIQILELVLLLTD